MIDIHSHILWGLDDGSDTRETSIRMIEIAAEAGTTDIVASPHADSRYEYQQETVRQQIEDLSAEVGAKVRIHRGCDFHLSYENIERALAEPRRYTVNGGRFLLVEFADTQIPGSARRIFEQFMTADVCPIITHPERNPILSRKLDDLAAWARMGALLQITAKSLEGGFGSRPRDAAWKMLSQGIVHFVASDAHDTEHRPPRLDSARRLIAARMGEDAADQLLESNPHVVVTGGDPAFVVAPEPEQRRSFFDFLRR